MSSSLWHITELMQVQRLRRWSNIEPVMCHCIVFNGHVWSYNWTIFFWQRILFDIWISYNWHLVWVCQLYQWQPDTYLKGQIRESPIIGSIPEKPLWRFIHWQPIYLIPSSDVDFDCFGSTPHNFAWIYQLPKVLNLCQCLLADGEDTFYLNLTNLRAPAR